MQEPREKAEFQIKRLDQARQDIQNLERYGSIFTGYKWLSLLENSLNLKYRVAVWHDDGVPIAYFPYVEKRIGTFRVNFSPLIGTETAYGGITSKKDEITDFLTSLKKTMSFFIIQPPKAKIERNLFYHEPKFTIVNRLEENAESYFHKIRKGHRYCIKKALRSNVGVEEGYTKADFAHYYSLIKHTYEESGISPLQYKFYFNVMETFHENENLKLFFATYEGEKIAAICVLKWDNTGYYWTGGSLKSEEVKTLYPNHLLQWEAIKWAYSQNLKEYDMLGGDIPSIRNFKMGFGGELIEKYQIYSDKHLHFLAEMYEKLGGKFKDLIRKGIRR